MALTRPFAVPLRRTDDWRAVSACRDTDPDLFFPVGTTGPAHRADRDRQGRLQRPARPRAVPRVRPHHQPGLRHLGRHLRGGAPQAPSPVARRPAPRQLTPTALPQCPRPPPGEAVARPGPTSGRTGTERRTTVPGRCRLGPVAPADSIEPPSSVVTSVRTIDRPSPVAASREKPSGRPDAVVGHVDDEARRRRWPARRPHVAAAGVGAVGVGVVDRVLQQLGEHHRQRAWRPPRAGSPASPVDRERGSGARARSGPPRPCGRAAARSRRTARRRRRRATASRAPGRSTGCAAPTPRSPPWPRATTGAGACSRSSDEIVCRLFFTRWWISRIVASFESSRRSRRRSSVTSRSSTSAPVTAPCSSSGMAPHEHRDLGPRSISSVAGRRLGEGGAHRGLVRSRARRAACPRRWRGSRCGAGPRRRSARRRRPASTSSRTITPSPTRGASSLDPRRRRTGTRPRRSCGRSGRTPRRRRARARPAGARRAAPTRGSPPRRCGPGGGPGCTARGPARGATSPVTSPSMISPRRRPGHERPLGLGDDAADQVAAEQRLAGGRADLAEHDERPASGLR